MTAKLNQPLGENNRPRSCGTAIMMRLLRTMGPLILLLPTTSWAQLDWKETQSIRQLQDLSVSPDGNQIFVAVNEPEGASTRRSVWVYDVKTGSLSKTNLDSTPRWTRDGRPIV